MAKRSASSSPSRDTTTSKKSKSENVDSKKIENFLEENKISIKAVDENVISAPQIAFDFSKESTGLSKTLCKYLKKKFDGGKPTPIQSCVWPLLSAGKDMCGIAETGSGKTLAFLLPFMSRKEHGGDNLHKRKPFMLVLAPTRELAKQIHEVVEEANKEGGKEAFPSACLYGGVPKYEHEALLKKSKLSIVVGTPGRVLDLVQSGHLDLSSVKYSVLDEADRMLDMGFLPSVTDILKAMPRSEEGRQTAMFSATWAKEVRKLSKCMMHPSRVTITVGKSPAQSDQLSSNVRILQKVEVVEGRDQKREAMNRHMRDLVKKGGKDWKVIIFALYKKEAAHLEKVFNDQGYLVLPLHGDMAQSAREKSIKTFTEKKNCVLVATDVAARGLDVPDVTGVLNVTFPLTIEDYVHRIGRTGRAGRTDGIAVTLFNAGEPNEKVFALDLVGVMERAGQEVPGSLRALSQQGGGQKATKKKAHPLYGSHFKDEEEMAKLTAQKLHTTFEDSDSD